MRWTLALWAMAVAAVGCQQILGLEQGAPLEPSTSSTAGGQGGGSGGLGGGGSDNGGGGVGPGCGMDGQGTPGSAAKGWSFDAGSNDAEGLAIASDSHANIIVGGWFANSLTPCGASLAPVDTEVAFVAKLSLEGDLLWCTTYETATSGNQRVNDIAVTSTDDIVIAGDFVGKITLGTSDLTANDNSGFVAILDGKSGSALRSLQLSTTASGTVHAAAVATSPTAIWVAADFDGSMLNPSLSFSGGRDVFVSKLDGNLVPLATYQLGTDDSAQVLANGLAPSTQADSVVLVGAYNGTLNIGTDMATSAALDGFAIGLDQAAATYAWSTLAKGGGTTSITDVDIGALGGITIVGIHSQLSMLSSSGVDKTIDWSNNPSAWVARLDANGNPDWTMSFSESALDSFALDAIAQYADGRTVFGGDYGSTMGVSRYTLGGTQGNRHGFFVSAEENGTLAVIHEASATTANISDVAIDACDAPLLLVNFSGNVDVTGRTLTSNGKGIGIFRLY